MRRVSLLTAGRYGATTALVLLGLSFLADVGAISPFGGWTADVYYLPLKDIPLGDQRRAVEDSLIDTHGRVERYQRSPWLVIHGCAFAGTAAACAALWMRHRAGDVKAVARSRVT